MNKLYFIHLPKTGGTSIINALRAKGMCGMVSPGKTLLTRDFSEDLEQHADKPIIIGHFHYGIHEQSCVPYEYATVLRHPAARVMSDFKYIKKLKSNKVPHLGAKFTDSFGSFCKNYWSAQNQMTRQLCGLGHSDLRPLTDDDLSDAIRNLMSISYIGTTESMGKFWTRLAEDYGIKGVLPRANVTASHDYRSMGKADINVALEHNQYDKILWDLARKFTGERCD